MNSTVWWQSKTLGAALIAFLATIAQARWGMVISPEYQGIILTAIMVILRLITTGPVTATKEANPVGEAQVYAAQTVKTADKAETAVVNAAENVADLKEGVAMDVAACKKDPEKCGK